MTRPSTNSGSGLLEIAAIVGGTMVGFHRHPSVWLGIAAVVIGLGLAYGYRPLPGMAVPLRIKLLTGFLTSCGGGIIVYALFN